MGTPIFGTRYVLAPTPEGEEHPNVMVSDLRKAAQQALEALETASRNGSDGLKRYELKELDDTITALRAALEQPEQESVAWNWVLDGKDYGPVYYGKPPDADITKQAEQGGRTVRFLYTTPPQRKPLTDDQIAQIDWKDGETLHDFARAIEKAHGIGGEE